MKRIAIALIATAALCSAQTYNESGGLVVMEMESTPSSLGEWIKINPGDTNYVSGATGTGHFEFTGNTINGGDPNSPLTYTFKINQAGNYHLNLRARKRLDGAASDKCNDCWVKVAGDFTTGSAEYPTSELKVNTKLYGGTATGWGWATDLDSVLADHTPAIYNFKAGETYTLTISGRSIRFNLDRIVFRHSSVTESYARNTARPESDTITGGGADYVYDATTDFPDTTSGAVPYYTDNTRGALAIDASVVGYRGLFARASLTFGGTPGTYDATITSMRETDGECTYRLLVNGVQVGTSTNTPTATDYELQTHTFPNVTILAGATIAVESNTHSNGLVSEAGDGNPPWAWARGRWTQLELSTAAGSLVQPPAGRLAIVADGNSPDPDDIGATAVMLGILHGSGLQGRVVHLSHSCDLVKASNISAADELRRQNKLHALCGEGIGFFGPFGNLPAYFNCRTQQTAAVNDLRDAINASSASDPLWIIEAGEPDIIGYALQASTASKHQYVHVVSHHPANDNSGDYFTWAQILAFGVTEHQIGDQNVELQTAMSPWDWAENHSNPAMAWIWDQLKYAEQDGVVAFQTNKFDCSDAGMIYWWITGADSGGDNLSTPAEMKDMLLAGGTGGGSTKDPVAHWKLDEASGTTANDSSGNGYTGTVEGGATWGSDATRPLYVSFDGSNGHISTLFSYALASTDDFTWAWWANKQSADGTDGGAIMVGNRYPEGTPGENYEFIKLMPAETQFANTETTGPIEHYDYPDIVRDQWHHYAMVKTGTSCQWYVDGVAVGSPVTINYDESSPIPLLIGGDDNGSLKEGEHFEGYIDDVVLYRRALSAADLIGVQNGIYTPTVTLIDLGGPVDSTSGSSWSDGLPAHSDADYIIPDTGNLRSETGTSAFPGDTLTVEAGGKFQFRGKEELGELTTVNGLIATGGTSGLPVNLAAGIGQNTTNHLAGTLLNAGFTTLNGYGDATGPRNIRISSQVSGSGTLQSTGSAAYPHSCTIGNSGNTFLGTWESHVGTLVFANAGAVGAADISVLDDGKLEIQGNWASGSTLTVADTSTAEVDLGAYGWTVSSLVFGGVNVASGTYDAAALNALGTNPVFAGTGTITVALMETGGPVARWALDEGAGTVASDSSGNGHTGTLLNGVAWGSDGTRASYGVFDGSNDRVSTLFSYSLSSSDDFTWAWWAKQEGTNHYSAIMVGNRYPEGTPGEKYEFIKFTKQEAQFANTELAASIDKYNYTDLPQDEWHHYAMVKSGTSYQWYVDGVAEGGPMTRSYSEDATIPFLIGGDDDGSGTKANEHFEGCIDDVVLYDRALAASEVANLPSGIYGADPNLPVVDAGADQVVTLPASSVGLTGTASDNVAVVSTIWTQQSGPNTATLSGDTTLNLTASGLVFGSYVFRLTATDNESNSAYDEVNVNVVPEGGGTALITGELKKWHKVTFSWNGPSTSETAGTNPFSDYRLNLTFSHVGSGKTYTVPGYYAADGNAAETSSQSGDVWRAHFSPDEEGEWTYAASFRSGSDIAIETASGAGVSGGFFDGDGGSFQIAATDKTGRDLRSKGRLQYVGKHHLRFAETGEYFLKAGADAPENFLAYDDFDDTPNDGDNQPNLRKSWSPHAGDYHGATAAAFTWQGGKGTEILGAVRYLSQKGVNVFSFLTFNVDGDDDNVFPHRLKSTVAAYEAVADDARWAHANGVHHDRFDVSKMAQWERVFEYGTQQGMYLHFKTQETENEERMDSGGFGRERMLYYRELVARFGHHLALNWNLGEENQDNTDAERKAFAQWFYDNDPYLHNVVLHTYPNAKDAVYTPMLGSASKLTGLSLQTNQTDFSLVFPHTLEWVQNSAGAGVPWVVACDEPGDAQHALRPAGDTDNSWTDGRKNALWGNVMAGGAGVEFYFGYQHAHSDLTCQDYRTRDGFWDYCRYMLEFFGNNSVPFQDMSNEDALSSNANSWCLRKPGEAYVVYLKNGGTTNLDLSTASGDFDVRWYDPRNGGVLQTGSVALVTGGSTVSLGTAPSASTSDWVVYVSDGTGGGETTNGVLLGLANDADVRDDAVIVNLTADDLVPGRSGASGGYNRTTVFVFELPNLGVTDDPFIAATLSFNVESTSASPPGVDLYGLGRRILPDVLAGDYYGETAVPDPTDAELIQSNILNGSTGTGNINSSASSALAAYLNAQYDGGNGIGEHVFLRLTTNAPISGLQRHYITSTEGAAGTDSIRPRVSYTAHAPQDFDTWLGSFTFAPGADTSPEGDPDGDGFDTWTEYLFGLDPSDGSSVSPINVGLSKATGTFSYTRRNPSLTGVTDYQIWTSDNLSGWTHDDTALQTPDGEGDIQEVTVTLSGHPLSATKLFVQVRADN